MSKQVKWRRGTTEEHSTFIGAVGEVTVDTTKDTLVVHDGVTLGGHSIPEPRDWRGFTDELYAQAGITDNGLPDTIGASQRVEAINRLLADTPTSALASGIPMDGSARSTEINAVLAAGRDLYLPAGAVDASSLLLKNASKLSGAGQFVTTIKSGTVDSDIITMGNGQADTKIRDLKLEGRGRVSQTNENGIRYVGNSNCRRNGIENVAIYEFSGSGIDFSAGWSNYLRNAVITSCGVGLGFTASPLLAGWSGSGFVMESSYIATCDVGISMGAIWNFTSINTVIEDCVLPINQTAGGSPAVWINTWFESNAKSPKLSYSNVFIGGRLEGGESPAAGFFDNMSLPAAPYDYECITTVSQGIEVFRDYSDQVFKADGQGVKFFKPHSSLGWDVTDAQGTAKLFSVGRGGDALGGGVTSTTWGTDGGVWKDVTQLTGARHLHSHVAGVMPKLGVKVQAQGSSSLTGLGYVRTVFSSGVYETGGAGITNYGDRWQVHEEGHFSPLTDGAFDIGLAASTRVRDLRIVNAPIVGSDYRIKDNVSAIPQELLDFVLSTEIKQYTLKGRERTHYGIVITPEFLDALNNVVSLDSCAAFCHDIFKDSDGNPVDAVVNGVTLGDLWQVRYDEWQNILLEALRRKVVNTTA